MVKPITPQEVTREIPDFVINTVNNLIQQKWDGREAVIKQNEIMVIISSNDADDPRPTRKEVYDHNWLDFEKLYEKVGWECKYFKPPYYESWDPYFKFKKK